MKEKGVSSGKTINAMLVEAARQLDERKFNDLLERGAMPDVVCEDPVFGGPAMTAGDALKQAHDSENYGEEERQIARRMMESLNERKKLHESIVRVANSLIKSSYSEDGSSPAYAALKTALQQQEADILARVHLARAQGLPRISRMAKGLNTKADRLVFDLINIMGDLTDIMRHVQHIEAIIGINMIFNDDLRTNAVILRHNKQFLDSLEKYSRDMQSLRHAIDSDRQSDFVHDSRLINSFEQWAKEKVGNNPDIYSSIATIRDIMAGEGRPVDNAYSVNSPNSGRQRDMSTDMTP